MISREWSEPVFVHAVSNGKLEDFYVYPVPDGYEAQFTAGENFQEQQLYKARSSSPLGPWENIEEILRQKHIRFEKGADWPDNQSPWTRIVSMEWPGMPKVGMWLCYDTGKITVRSLFIEPKAGTLYSIVAANPAVILDRSEAEYNIFFEGRTEEVKWRVFQAVWSPYRDELNVIDEPLMDGANPFIARFDDIYCLYFSKPVGNGFETWAMTQEAE